MDPLKRQASSRNLGREQDQPWFTRVSSVQVELEFKNVVFSGGTKTGENSRSKTRTNNKLCPDMATLGGGTLILQKCMERSPTHSSTDAILFWYLSFTDLANDTLFRK